MKKKVIAFFNRLQPIFGRLGNNKYLQAIMGAMMATLGPMILGSLATLIAVYAGKMGIKTISSNHGIC